MKYKQLSILSFGIFLFSCGADKNSFDASGTFEAVETIISAEVNGKILSFGITEGATLKQGDTIGFIDSTQLYLSKLQLIQSRKAILSGKPDVKTQIESLQKELASAITDRKRIENLVKGEVASQKQLDDANTRVEIIQSKIDAQKSVLNTSTSTITEQGSTVEVRLTQTEDQLRKCKIVNPVNGTVLSKFAEQNEMAAIGKPLYKIADLSTIILRAYITGDQLTQVKINQRVKVLTDDGKGGFKEDHGIITWINDKSEFTPKTIQTKNERANMVYAIKVKVTNDGTYKIGMYGEIKFQ